MNKFLPLSLASLMTTTALPAFADCSPEGGLTVTCTGIDADGYIDNAQDTLITVLENATVNSTNGIAFNLGGGEDVLQTSGTINGSAFFRGNDDRFEIFGTEYTSIFGGTGSIFDGGFGYDIVNFGDIVFDDVTVAKIDDGFDLRIINSVGSRFSISLTNWEEFSFVGGRGSIVFTAEELEDFAIAPVPLPAGGLLMLTGMAGLVSLRRRRK